MNQAATPSSNHPFFDSSAFLKTLPGKPGVYRMRDGSGTVIYVGKAINLKKRLASYFRKNLDSPKTRVLVSRIHSIEVTVTHTETEALLLENNLIKSLKPRYNVLYRDDKSYPSIFLSSQHDFPALGVHRGAQRRKGRYFGPYPSAGAVRETLNLLQKLFPVRQCEDSFFGNRSRACLQYQIKRCTAPCVGLISKQAYAEDVAHAVMFLQGKSSEVIDALVSCMEQAAEKLDFEQAARYRDQIASLRRIQEKQYISQEQGDFDVIAASTAGGLGCIQIFTIRGGRNLGNRSFFPRQVEMAMEQADSAENAAALLDAFLPQHYLAAESGQGSRDIPTEILLSHRPANMALLEQALNVQEGRKIRLATRLRGQRARWLKMAQQNAEQALSLRLNSKANMLQRFEALQEALELADMPTRLECFDISHTMGEATVASCVVFDLNGPLKSDYRRFNIEDITGGDDYAAMRQALSRRYKRLKEGEAKLPDILFIDGGKGQLSQAQAVLEEQQINGVLLVGIAKGPERKPGKEVLWLCQPDTGIDSDSGLLDGAREIILSADASALHLIQQIRDEAHRFAITGHRQRRQRTRNTSVLEAIPGLGPKRRQLLLKQFGGLQEVARAGMDDLASVSGISPALAQLIYDAFHTDGNE
ncbi:MAG TPA: excinuclease ABC subunit UvrC [Gammaproteobacteria bacterium]|nr:excinuclease ABC subunit UvrC [Gammaproteobacteria bacterium]